MKNRIKEGQPVALVTGAGGGIGVCLF